MSKYPPLFKRIPFESKQAGLDIAEVQEAFEAFWRAIQYKSPKNSEKTQAMRKLQESCMWFTRAIALGAFKPSDSETVIDRRLPKGLMEQSRDFYESFEQQPKTQIILKPKKPRDYTDK